VSPNEISRPIYCYYTHKPVRINHVEGKMLIGTDTAFITLLLDVFYDNEAVDQNETLSLPYPALKISEKSPVIVYEVFTRDRNLRHYLSEVVYLYFSLAMSCNTASVDDKLTKNQYLKELTSQAESDFYEIFSKSYYFALPYFEFYTEFPCQYLNNNLDFDSVFKSYFEEHKQEVDYIFSLCKGDNLKLELIFKQALKITNLDDFIYNFVFNRGNFNNNRTISFNILHYYSYVTARNAAFSYDRVRSNPAKDDQIFTKLLINLEAEQFNYVNQILKTFKSGSMSCSII
jgi:hypothetical protein